MSDESLSKKLVIACQFSEPAVVIAAGFFFNWVFFAIAMGRAAEPLAGCLLPGNGANSGTLDVATRKGIALISFNRSFFYNWGIIFLEFFMNVIGTVLERSESNKFYVKFKNEVGVVDDELYAWKVWILKKYFHDNVVINLVKMLIGVICFGLAASNMVIKVLGKSGFSTLILIVLFALGFILIATGLLFSILNFRFGKRYEDFLWDEDGEIVNKIIKFYGKA